MATDHWPLILLFAIFVILVILSAFFSGTETALIAFNRHRLRYYGKKDPRAAQRLKQLLHRPHDFIATVLICNNFVNVAASAIATYLCVYFFGDKGVLISTLAVTMILLVFAEISPKTYATGHADQLALQVARPLYLLITVLRPLTRLLSVFTGLLVRPAVSGDQRQEPLFEEEIKSFILTGREAGLLNHQEFLMMHNILEIEKTTVKEIMIPRQEVAMLQLHTPYAEIQRLIRQHGFSRYPVYRDNREDVIGYLHIKDLLTHQFGKRFSLKQIVRPVLFVPEIMPLDNLMDTFRQHQTHIAIVVDEYGGMEGLVTMEDVIEEIIGEMRDEMSNGSTAEIIAMQNGSYLVRADIPVRRLNHEIPFLEIPEDEEYHHLAGFVLSRLGKIPAPGDSIETDTARLTVTRVTANKISLIKIIPLAGAEAAPLTGQGKSNT
ncbi:MAG: HlyC/CorC family transporter [Deltaproteobacteria bacterium]|nr:HlyC/CorC family transporter [Deltaproteobacteria bacterium]